MVTELQQREGSSSDDQKKVLEMLQRVEASDEEEVDWEDIDSDDEPEEAGDLAERLGEVDLNDADAVWERLTDEEKQEFKSIVYNGEIEKIVESVEPWWRQKLEDRLVRDLQEDALKVKKILKSCPKLPAIKEFHKISTKPPAPCIIHNIANVIGAYTFIFRLFNGDHLNYELEAADNLISICDNLKANANFESVVSVADSIMLNCHNLSLFSDLNTKQAVVDDVKDILEGPGDDQHSNAFILSALADVHRLLKLAKQKKFSEPPPPEPSTTGSSTSKKFSSEFLGIDQNRTDFKQLENQTHLVGCLKKVEFYLSFVKSRYNQKEWPVVWQVE